MNEEKELTIDLRYLAKTYGIEYVREAVFTENYDKLILRGSTKK